MQELYIFNPDCELAIADGDKFYTPPKNIRSMIHDLDYLPAYLAGRDGYVLVGDRNKALNFDNGLDIGCRFVEEADVDSVKEGWLGMPWGMSPRMCRWLTERSMGGCWKKEWKEWFSRKTALRGLELLADEGVVEDSDIIPKVFNDLKHLSEVAEEGKWLVKAPWSSSGKGLLRIENGLHKKETEWISGILKHQGYLMLEKWLDKQEDFAMEFKMTEENCRFCGWSVFKTGEYGEYAYNIVSSQSLLEERLEKKVEKARLERLKTAVPEMLKLILPDYRGYLGVDMMVYKDREGRMQIHPCVEINLRYNMGILALKLYEDFMAEGSCGKFYITFDAKPGEALKRAAREEGDKAVLVNGRLSEGKIPLTPVDENTQFSAWLEAKK